MADAFGIVPVAFDCCVSAMSLAAIALSGAAIAWGRTPDAWGMNERRATPGRARGAIFFHS
jgi:hypothetical protein